MKLREITRLAQWDEPASYAVWACCLLAAAGWALSLYYWCGGDARAISFLKPIYWAWTGAVPMALLANFVGSRARRLTQRRYSLLGLGSYAAYMFILVTAIFRG